MTWKSSRPIIATRWMLPPARPCAWARWWPMPLAAVWRIAPSTAARDTPASGRRTRSVLPPSAAAISSATIRCSSPAPASASKSATRPPAECHMHWAPRAPRASSRAGARASSICRTCWGCADRVQSRGLPAAAANRRQSPSRSPIVPQFPPAILVLADGTVFRGNAIGAAGASVGEVVFNTAMTGYQEILTDPSYCRQIVTLTYPHIGNTGINREDCESPKVFAAGLVIRDLPLAASNFRSEQSLDAYLKEENVVAIADIDTRKLTRILREKGSQAGCLLGGAQAGALSDDDVARAIGAARAFPGLGGMDLAKVVSVDKPYAWTECEWALGNGYATPQVGECHVV